MHLSVLEVSLEKTPESKEMPEMIGGKHGLSPLVKWARGHQAGLLKLKPSIFYMNANSFPKHSLLMELVWLPPYRNFTKL